MSKIDSQSFVAGVHNQPTDPVISLSYSSHFALLLYWSVCFPLPNTCTSLFVLFAKYLESKILSRVSRKLQLASRWCNIVLKKCHTPSIIIYWLQHREQHASEIYLQLRGQSSPSHILKGLNA